MTLFGELVTVVGMGQERNIEKRGLLLLTDEERSQQRLEVVVSFVRPPTSPYLNAKTNPPRSFYGWATVFRGAYVERQVELLFRDQVVYAWDNDVIQSHALLDCLNRSIQTSVLSFSQIISPTVLIGSLSEVDPPSIETLGCPVTAIKFVLVDGVRAVVRASEVEVKRCNPDDAPVELSEPSAPPADNSGSFVLSEPYDPSTNDNGDTFSPDTPSGAEGLYEFIFTQQDCFGGYYSPYTFELFGYAADAPFLTTSVPPGATPGNGLCCGGSAPYTYLVSSWDGRNMSPGGNNFNQDCLEYDLTYTFTPL